MTNKEAIGHLLTIMIYSETDGYTDKAREALEMAVKALEQQTGHWIKEQGNIYKCSNCRHFLDFYGVNAGRGDANYCPNCGARMERKNYDN